MSCKRSILLMTRRFWTKYLLSWDYLERLEGNVLTKTLIIGSEGTGKTTIVSQIINKIKSYYGQDLVDTAVVHRPKELLDADIDPMRKTILVVFIDDPDYTLMGSRGKETREEITFLTRIRHEFKDYKAIYLITTSHAVRLLRPYFRQSDCIIFTSCLQDYADSEEIRRWLGRFWFTTLKRITIKKKTVDPKYMTWAVVRFLDGETLLVNFSLLSGVRHLTREKLSESQRD